jgi:hypothetical protein
MKNTLLVTAAFCCLAFPSYSADRSLATYQGFSATVPEDNSWCGPVATINVAAPAALGFDGSEDKLSKLTGGLRAIISVECPVAKSIRLLGSVDGQQVYEGLASAESGWVLSETVPPSPEETKLLADLEVINQCDDLGSHPDDPEAMADGVSDESLDGKAVIASCSKAVAIDGETPRLKFQLGRGYWKEGQVEEAIEQFLPAAEAEHGGALAYLGDVYMDGLGGVEADPAQARTLYQKSADAGFKPATAILASFEDKTTELAQAEAEEKADAAQLANEQRNASLSASSASAPAKGGALNTRGYEKPDFMSAIYSGDYDNTGLNRRFTQIYLVNMAETMRQVCRGSFTITELNGWRRLVLSEVDTSPAAGWAAIGSMFETVAGIADGSVNVAEIASNSADVDAIPQMASEDAMTFIERNNCDSATFERFTSNMREAVK